jgi:hypothetical protein
MIFTHTLINQIKGDKSRKRTAREELWKAQGCDLFYPSAERGLCRPELRSAAYHALLEAERMTREKKGSFIPSLMNFDFDMDGSSEFLFQDTKINCYIQARGASVFELDYLPKGWNYLDTWPSSGNKYKRTAFSDCLFPAEAILPDAFNYSANTFGGRNCSAERYTLSELDKAHGKIRFCLGSKNNVPFGAIEIDKCYSLKKDTLSVSYTLTNKGQTAADFQFAPVIDFSFPGEGEGFLRVFKCKTGAKETAFSDGTVNDADSIKFQDLKNETLLVLASKKPFNAGILPVSSPGDQYQSTSIVPMQTVSLQSGEKWETEFSLKIAH